MSHFFLWNLVDILIAVIIDWMVGDPYWFPHPVIYIGKAISYLDKKGRKLFSNDRKLKAYGGFIVLTIMFLSFSIPFLALYLLRGNFYLYHCLNIFILWTTIAAKCLKDEGLKVYYALLKEDILDARKKLSYIVGRDTSSLTEKEIIRADVETIAENTADGVIAPLIYGMILGAPFAMLYKGVNTMDSMLGYKNEKFINIGFFPAKVDDIFNFFPARITGILICLSAPILKGNIIEAFKIMIRDRKNHKSPNCAYPEGAAAGAMKVQLGGTNVYFGEVVYKPTIGDKIIELNKEHILGTVKLMYFSEVLFLIIAFIIAILINNT